MINYTDNYYVSQNLFLNNNIDNEELFSKNYDFNNEVQDFNEEMLNEFLYGNDFAENSKNTSVQEQISKRKLSQISAVTPLHQKKTKVLELEQEIPPSCQKYQGAMQPLNDEKNSQYKFKTQRELINKVAKNFKNQNEEDVPIRSLEKHFKRKEKPCMYGCQETFNNLYERLVIPNKEKNESHLSNRCLILQKILDYFIENNKKFKTQKACFQELLKIENLWYILLKKNFIEGKIKNFENLNIKNVYTKYLNKFNECYKKNLEIIDSLIEKQFPQLRSHLINKNSKCANGCTNKFLTHKQKLCN